MERVRVYNCFVRPDSIGDGIWKPEERDVYVAAKSPETAGTLYSHRFGLEIERVEVFETEKTVPAEEDGQFYSPEEFDKLGRDDPELNA